MGAEHGDIHWTELNCRADQVGAVVDFYTGILGHQVNEVPMGGPHPYRILMKGEEMVGGIFVMDGEEFTTSTETWLTYFAVDDADAAATQVAEKGGQVLRPPWDVPGVGRMFIAADPAGAPVGMMTPSD